MNLLKKNKRAYACVATICLIFLAGLSCMMQESDENGLIIQAYAFTQSGEVYQVGEENDGIVAKIREKLDFLPFMKSEEFYLGVYPSGTAITGLAYGIALRVNNVTEMSTQLLEWEYGYRAVAQIYVDDVLMGSIVSESGSSTSAHYGISYNETTPASSTFTDCRGTVAITDGDASNWHIGEMTHSSETLEYLILSDLANGTHGTDYYYQPETDYLYIGLHLTPFASAPTWYTAVHTGNMTVYSVKPDMYYVSFADSNIFNTIKTLGDVYDGKNIVIRFYAEVVISDGSSTTMENAWISQTLFYRDGNVYLPSTASIGATGVVEETEPV